MQHVLGIQLHGCLGREVDDDQTREPAVEQHKAADVRLEAGARDALHHAGVVDFALRGLVEHPGDRVAQAGENVFDAVHDGVFCGFHAAALDG